MHPNPAFRKEGRARNIEFARDRSFGTLAINAEEGPLMAHIPFELSPDGDFLRAHLVRSNPIWHQIKTPQRAVLSILGPDSYVSPDWYEVPDQVPTWNYVAVHLRGTLKRLPQAEIEDILVSLSARMEARLLPKKPWTINKMDPEIYQRMLRQIVPVAMDVDEIDGTWKLSQNKPDEVRVRAAAGISEWGIGAEIAVLGEWVRLAESQ